MVLIQQTRTRSKIFHICDAYDIASIKAQREQEELQSRHERSEDEIYEEEKHDPLRAGKALSHHHVPGSLQVINFVRTNISYEYASKYLDATDVSAALA